MKTRLIILRGCASLLLAAGAPTLADTEAAKEQGLTAQQELVPPGANSAQAWYQLAVSARSAGDTDTAIDALHKAESKQFSPVRISIERARIEVARGKPDTAVAALRQLFDNGFPAVGVLTGDPALGSLAGHAGFDALVAEMTAAAYPCEHREQFREFDFWVGDWDVHLADGTLAGHNQITVAQRGCVLTESWTSVSGGSGMSINYLDKTTDEWVQIWNAEGGSQINIRGGLTDDGMSLHGQIHYIGTATTAPFHGLWTPQPDGRVRQFFETSNDDGETWVPWFEGFYTRVEKDSQNN